MISPEIIAAIRETGMRCSSRSGSAAWKSVFGHCLPTIERIIAK
jgi:hypothetical protein